MVPKLSPAQVHRVSWWMSMFGAATPKRQYAWSNSRAIRKLDVGWKRMKAQVKTCEHYYNKAGKKCWKGTRFLKPTQLLGWIYGYDLALLLTWFYKLWGPCPRYFWGALKQFHGLLSYQHCHVVDLSISKWKGNRLLPEHLCGFPHVSTVSLTFPKWNTTTYGSTIYVSLPILPEK